MVLGVTYVFAGADEVAEKSPVDRRLSALDHLDGVDSLVLSLAELGEF